MEAAKEKSPSPTKRISSCSLKGMVGFVFWAERDLLKLLEGLGCLWALRLGNLAGGVDVGFSFRFLFFAIVVLPYSGCISSRRWPAGERHCRLV